MPSGFPSRKYSKVVVFGKVSNRGLGASHFGKYMSTLKRVRLKELRLDIQIVNNPFKHQIAAVVEIP